jgi:hypothetical protein
MGLLSTCTPSDELHDNVLGCHERKLLHKSRVNTSRVDDKTRSNIVQCHHDSITAKEDVREVDTADGTY